MRYASDAISISSHPFQGLNFIIWYNLPQNQCKSAKPAAKSILMTTLRLNFFVIK